MENPFKSFIERVDRILDKDLTSEEKLSKIMTIANHFSVSIEKKNEKEKSIRERALKTAKRYMRLAEENKTEGTVDIQQMNYRIAEVVSSLLGD